MAVAKPARLTATWQLADARRKFSEVFTRTIEEGPQRVTRRGDVIVLLSGEEYERLVYPKPKKSFKEFLQSGPSLEGLDLTRDSSPMRDVDW